VIQKLDDAQIAWRIAAVSPSLAGLWASAMRGLGITARSALGLPARLVCNRRMFDLPLLDTFPVTLHTRQGVLGEGVERLRVIVREAVGKTGLAGGARKTRRLMMVGS